MGNTTELKNFFEKLKNEPALQEGFKQHMVQNMRGVDSEIGTMQRAMNARIAQGFMDFAQENGFSVTEEEINGLLESVSAGLHGKMQKLFRQEFAAAIGKMMQSE